MTAEILKKVLAPLKLNQDKEMPRTQNDLLICFCQWTRVEKRDIRVVDVEEPNMNNGNSMDCSDIKISDDSADGWIANAINSGNFTVCAKDATGSLITDIYSVFYMDFSDIKISDYSTDVLISTAIDSTYFTNTNVSYYVIGGLMFLMC